MIKKTTLLSLLAMSAMAQDGFGDAANNAIDSAQDAADEGAAIADGALDDAESIAADAEGDADALLADGTEAAKTASNDNAAAANGDDWRYWAAPSLWIGIIQTVDVVWWFIWGWFVYIKTNTSDDNLREVSWTTGVAFDALPIAWFWNNTAHPTKGYTALTYLFVWLFYLLISVPGMIFWIWQLVEAEEDKCVGASGTWLFKMWSEYPGLYGSWILYFLTVLMPILQLGQINGDIFAAGYTNAIVQIVMLSLTWIATGVIHVLFVPALNQEWTDRCENKAAPVVVEVIDEVIEAAVEEVEPEVDDGNDWD